MRLVLCAINKKGQRQGIKAEKGKRQGRKKGEVENQRQNHFVQERW